MAMALKHNEALEYGLMTAMVWKQACRRHWWILCAKTWSM